MDPSPRDPRPARPAVTRDGEKTSVLSRCSVPERNKGVALNARLRNIPPLEAFTVVNRCAASRSFGDMPSNPPAPPPHPSPRRRTRIPPALTRGAESMPGIGILDEVAGDLGVLLWRSVRNVTLWAATPPASRGALFAGGAADVREADLARVQVDPEIVAPLSVMVRLLESPPAMEVGRLVNACRRISVWAEQRGALATALEFMQAAALSAPQVAALAYAVGRLARRRAEYDRAESWFGRAIVQARRSGDWRTYALGYSGLGNLNVQKGNFPTAKRAHSRCLRAALRHELHDLQGSAYHDLFVTEIETGAGSSADAFAEQAFRAYGEENPRVPRLAYDVAYHWMLEGFFADSLRLAQALQRHFEAPAEQALVLGLVARSAGGAGDRRAFDRARLAVDGLSGAGDAAARALLGIAYGAASLREWEMAQAYATRALHLATERREGRVVMAAEAALESVSAGLSAQANPPRPSATRLADAFVEALTRPAGGTLVEA